jgi:hypothetical protein
MSGCNFRKSHYFMAFYKKNPVTTIFLWPEEWFSFLGVCQLLSPVAAINAFFLPL